MKLLDALKKAGKDFSEDECMISGAALAYYTIFSLPPLLVIVFAVAGWFGIDENRIDSLVKEQLGIPITEVAGDDQSAEDADETTDSEQAAGQQGESSDEEEGAMSNIAGIGWISRLVGIGLLIFSATGLFAQFQYALNRAWEVEPDPEKSGVKGFITKRLLSLGMVAIIAFLLLVSLVLTTVVDEIVGVIQGSDPNAVMLAVGIVINNLLVLIVATFLFAAMFKVLPDATTSWRDLMIGSFITAFLFVLGKAIIGWYLQNSDIGSGWGSAASSMVGVLVWVYYSSLIVLFGAELAQVWANQFGNGIKPAEGAVRIVEVKRHVRV